MYKYCADFEKSNSQNMPLKHQGAESHKMMMLFVNLCVFVPWWQMKAFWSGFNRNLFAFKVLSVNLNSLIIDGSLIIWNESGK